MKLYILFLSTLILCFNDLYASPSKVTLSATELKQERASILKKLGKYPELFAPWRSESVRKVMLEQVRVSTDRKTLQLYCNVGLAQISIRTELLDTWAEEVREELGDDYDECDVRFYAYNIPAERFIPNLYRDRADRDSKRASTPFNRRPLVRRIDRSIYGEGLGGRHIALWAAHGKYYHQEEDSTWKWQRAALFCSIEDLNTAQYVTRYLAPMLESAGAVVVMPRERDPNPTEIIIDNDRSTTRTARISTSGMWNKQPAGFAIQDTIRNQNPFLEGSALQAQITPNRKPLITYLPSLNRPNTYGVYVSWKAQESNLTNARYTVYHAGGKAEFEVNQRIGGSMWVWLGEFEMDNTSKITLTAPSDARSGTLSADAVKIGGGMGNTKRAGKISGVSRYLEAPRYWMQYSGAPESLYAQETLSDDNKDSLLLDYIDSFKSTGDWCNYIRNEKNIPLDIALGIHTDAGINDSIVGTMSIHYTNRTRNKYSNGKSKLAGRDFADIVQTQIVDDLRAKYDTTWTRRSMYDRSYAEISRPNMPAILIEMFSHQNAKDMALGLDPAFRFDISRAIYKGIVRFLADRYGRSYTIQPLPPSAPRVELISSDSVRLSWSPTTDPLEPTAKPNRYRVYQRNGGAEATFDEGREVRFAEIKLPLKRNGKVYSYRITALNEGGESFPTEIISAGLAPQEQGKALVVNAFTRVSPPALKRDAKNKLVGFDLNADPGIPYIQDRAIVGMQIDFDSLSPFEDNDNPGWGASSTELMPNGLTGNTFDYPSVHGSALLEAGYSFVSCSRDAFAKQPFRPSQYQLVDVIMGAQRSYPTRYKVYDDALLKQLRNVIDGGVSLIISGSYIGSDPSASTEAKNLLGYTYTGVVRNPLKQSNSLYFTPTIDQLKPITGAEAITVTGLSNGVQHKNVYSFGFPLESLQTNALQELFEQILTQKE